jgi:glucose/arabinose dehydrogenase
MPRTVTLLVLASALACSCQAQDGGGGAAVPAGKTGATIDSPIQREAKAVEPVFAITEVASFREPWAMAFLPDGRLLVSEKRGALKLVQPGGTVGDICGLP